MGCWDSQPSAFLDALSKVYNTALQQGSRLLMWASEFPEEHIQKLFCWLEPPKQHFLLSLQLGHSASCSVWAISAAWGREFYRNRQRRLSLFWFLLLSLENLYLLIFLFPFSWKRKKMIQNFECSLSFC